MQPTGKIFLQRLGKINTFEFFKFQNTIRCVVFVVLPRGKLHDGELEEDAEREMLRSSLWATLFRGGYMAANRLERSLSGKHVRFSLLFCSAGARWRCGNVISVWLG